MKQNASFGRRLRVACKRYGRIILGGGILAVILTLAFLAPVLAPHDPNAVDVFGKFAPRSAEHLLGTDAIGRDVLSRLLHGARYSILLALLVQLCTVALGSLLGLLCGYYRVADQIIMRILEAVNALPTILLVFVISFILGQGIANMVLALVVGGITQVTRQVRAQVLSLRQKEYVESEIAMGARDLRTMLVHILPQCSSYLLVRLGSGMGNTILTMSTLAYLGVGLPSTIPSWGADIAKAQGTIMIHPNLVFYPMIAIALTVFACSMLGDGLRDVLDPKLK